MKFSPAFVDAHKRLAPAIPIKRFASIVNPTSIGMSSTQDFYAPVRFSVQASGKPNDATGIIRLDVAVQKNPDWLRDMKEQLTSTLGLSSSIELRTVTGMPLEMVPIEQLHNVGKLNVYDTRKDKAIRLDSLPQVPVEYRVTKVQELKQWAHKLSQGKMPEILAAVLKGKDVHEVEAALLSNGAMMNAIQSELSKNGDWAEFVRLHQSSSTKTPRPVEANQLLEKISRQILSYINSFIGAATEQVKAHIVAEQFKNMNQKGDAFRPVLSSVGSSRQKENPKLYQTLIEDALSVPMLQKSLVSSIYNFSPNTPSSQKNKLVAASRPLMKRIASNHHPWYAHIHHTLLPLKGTYPSDYLVKHTKQDMSAKAPYIGDVNQTYEAYHRFSGVSNAPPPCRIKNGIILDPISCHMSKKKSKKQQEKEIESNLYQGGMPKLIPIESNLSQGGMPKLIPIESNLSQGGMPKLIPIESNLSQGGMPKLIPIESNLSQGGMPKLIPIESNFSQGGMPKLIPIGCHGKCEGEECEKVDSEIPSVGMPKLIPIEGHYPHGKKHHGKKHHYRSDSSSGSGSDSDDVRAAIGSSLYDAIGRADEEDVDAAMQHTEADFAHLPDVNDVFK